MAQPPEHWTVLSMLEWATEYFEERDIPEPRLSIEWLLAHTLGVKRLDLYLQYDRPLSREERDQLRPLVKRRAQHEPLQYITGSTDFMHAEIEVNESVLIPRIETEQMVEIILDRHDGEGLRVLDVGTGSGCIPIALKMERSGWDLHGIDISEQALATARRNAEQNEVTVNFSKGDLRNPEQLDFEEPFDLIVSNPPYILTDEKSMLASQVRDYEPSEALFVEDMESMYRDLLVLSDSLLASDGSLYLETHEHHTENLLTIFAPDKWNVTLEKDYSKKPRFLIGTRKHTG